jgi:hypothetical protein
MMSEAKSRIASSLKAVNAASNYGDHCIAVMSGREWYEARRGGGARALKRHGIFYRHPINHSGPWRIRSLFIASAHLK